MPVNLRLPVNRMDLYRTLAPSDEPEPPADWQYMVDDAMVQYAPDDYPLVFCRCIPSYFGPCPYLAPDPRHAITALRLCPNGPYREWGAQSLALAEECREGRVILSGEWTFPVRSDPQSERGTTVLVHLSFEVDVTNWTAVFDNGRVALDQMPYELAAPVGRRLANLRAWYVAERDRRARRLPLRTAFGEWVCQLDTSRTNRPDLPGGQGAIPMSFQEA